MKRRSTVALVHPCSSINSSIGLLFESADFHVAISCASCDLLINKLKDRHVDAIFMHYSEIAQIDEVLKLIKNKNTSLALVASSDCYHSDTYTSMAGLIKKGVTGFLDLNEEAGKFLSKVERVIAGDLVISANFIYCLNNNEKDDAELLAGELTAREMDVLALVGEGRRNREIADTLFISESTVKVHIRSILFKLHLDNRQQIIAHALRKGMVEI